MITVHNFIAGLKLVKFKNGWISNGHWAINPKRTPESFRNRIAKKGEMPEHDIQNILDALGGQTFVEVFPVEEEKQPYEKGQAILYEPKDYSFLIGFDRNYLGWLLKSFPKLRIMACNPEKPARLYRGGILNEEIGLLMPRRV